MSGEPISVETWCRLISDLEIESLCSITSDEISPREKTLIAVPANAYSTSTITIMIIAPEITILSPKFS
jgi:hypothetical protein